MNFVNRIEEQARIRKIISGEKCGFIVVYGRRRCGKSTLLKQILTDADIYFMADQTESTQQISLFAQSIAQQFTGFDQVKYPNWEVLLTSLNQRVSKKYVW